MGCGDGGRARARAPRRGRPPAPQVLPLVQLAGGSALGPSEADRERLAERGFEVRVVPGVGHCIRYDDFDAFLDSMDGWL